MTQPLNERIAAQVNAVLEVASQLDRAELGQRLRDEAQRWRSSETTVVVAAEPNRGKSSLINALLGRPLLPVGTDLATTTVHVILRHGEPGARIHLDGREPIEVALDDVGPWITDAGRGEATVRAVELRLDHPALRTGLVLVDTPGVGGLDAAHGRITLAALRSADALLFVLDAGAPLSGPELQFLAAATERIDATTFCLTKIDRYRGWARVAEDDRALLTRHAPRFAAAPILPLSARLRAAAGDGQERDAELDRESGFPQLERHLLAGVVGKVAVVRLANLLRVADAVLEALTAPVRAAIGATAGGDEAKAAAERDQAALDDLREMAERAQLAITDRCNALRDRVQAELGKALREITAPLDAPDVRVGRDTGALVGAVESELQALDAQIGELIDVEIGALRDEIEATLADPTFAFSPLLAPESQPLDLGTRDTATPATPVDATTRLRIASSLASTGGGAAMASRFLGPETAILGALIGTGVVLGAVGTALNVRAMRRQRDLQTVKREVGQLVEQARAGATPRARQRILELQRAAEADLKRHVRRRTKELQESVAEATRLMRADASARERARVEGEQRLAALQRHKAAVDALTMETRQLRLSS